MNQTNRDTEKRLGSEDQARVERYLGSAQHSKDRGPFRLWRLLAIIWVVLMAMSGVSYWIAVSHGVI